MAYCRFGRDSDVYVYEVEHGIECCRCRLLDGRWFTAAGAAEMIEHLLAHRAAGHRVPDAALDELRAEAGSGEQAAGGDESGEVGAALAVSRREGQRPDQS